MRFYIKQYSTFPYLEYDLENISKEYDINPLDWEMAVATFSMYDKKNKIYKIANNPAEIISKPRKVSVLNEINYYLRYKFNQKNTSNIGEYYGEFKVDFVKSDRNKITIPNTDKIDISISKSITRTDYFVDKPILSNRLWYYGTFRVIGGIVDRPEPEDIDVLSGFSVFDQNPKNDINIPFNSTSQDFLWFAIPEEFPIKQRWEVNLLNTGNIGGNVDVKANLFPDPVLVEIENINYYLYISNYRTTLNTVKILNT